MRYLSLKSAGTNFSNKRTSVYGGNFQVEWVLGERKEKTEVIYIVLHLRTLLVLSSRGIKRNCGCHRDQQDE